MKGRRKPLTNEGEHWTMDSGGSSGSSWRTSAYLDRNILYKTKPGATPPNFALYKRKQYLLA